MFDLAVAANGDLIMASHDLGGVSGTDLLEQRMRVRLVLHRGAWTLDPDGTLGSSLFRLLGMPPEQAQQSVEPFVRDALNPMSDEIIVDDVWSQIENSPGGTPRGIMVVVVYRVAPTAEGGAASDESQRQVEILLSLGGL